MLSNWLRAATPYVIDELVRTSPFRVGDWAAHFCPQYEAYQYCIQHLPQGDDLHLMLVNTVRKVRHPRRTGIRISLDPISRI